MMFNLHFSIFVLNTFLNSSEYLIIKKHDKSINKTLVLYAYYEKMESYKKTLEFFIENVVQETNYIDYIFIIQ